MTARYRIIHTAGGAFRIGEKDSAGNWFAPVPDSFRDLTSAEEGLKRMIVERVWYYDAEGKPVDG